MRVGIAGAGLAGRVLALKLLARGHEVSLFERRAPGEAGAADVAAGMLSPLAELETGECGIYELGVRSLDLWPALLAMLDESVPFARRGSLMVSHARDSAIASRLIDRIRARLGDAADDEITSLDADALAMLEPGLPVDGPAWLLAGEGQVDARAFMRASRAFLEPRTEWHDGAEVSDVLPGELRFADGGRRRFDRVFDCRGTGASSSLPVRAVRGEILWLKTDEVTLTRPVRVMHPRYRIYVVPRGSGLFGVGATEIESDDDSPVSVRSTMELVSATAIVDPAFLEARILASEVGLRPAMPDNQPHVDVVDGRTVINGLFRHGYLIAPALIDDALDASLNPRSAA